MLLLIVAQMVLVLMESVYVILDSLGLIVIQHLFLILVIAHPVPMGTALMYLLIVSHAVVSQDILETHVM